MKVYPKAEVTIGLETGPPDGGTARGNMHTTETPSTGFYTRRVYYTFQVREHGGRVFWRQFIDPEHYSHALRHDSGDPETNREGKVNPSLAVVGYARNMPLMSDLLVKEIAEFWIWCEDELGIKPAFAVEPRGSECYGVNSPCRLTWEEWKTVEGWVPHQAVPGNSHWDAPFPKDRIEAAVAQIKDGQEPPDDPGTVEGTITMDVKLAVLEKYAGFASRGKAHLKGDVKTAQALLLSHGYADENTSDPRTYTDGKFGAGTEEAVRRFQQARGLSVDGVVSGGTWAELLRQA